MGDCQNEDLRVQFDRRLKVKFLGSNLKKLKDLSGDWIDKVHRRKPPKRLTLDTDSSISDTCS